MSSNKTIGVLQLGKNNEVIETLIAFKDYTKAFPDIHKTIILKESSKIFDGLIKKEFQQVIYIPSVDGTSLENNLGYIRANILKFSFSVLINLTYTKSSSYLCTIIEAKFKLGFKYTKNNFLTIEDSWSRYIYSVIMGKHINPFSIVDIYKSIIGNKNRTLEQAPIKFEKIILNTSSNVCKEAICEVCINFPNLEIILIGESDFAPNYPNLKIISSVEALLKLNITKGLYVGPYDVYSLICSYENALCINLYPPNLDPCLCMPYGTENLSCLENINQATLIEIIRNKGNEHVLRTQEGNGYFLYNIPANKRTYDIQDIFLQFYKYAFTIFLEDIEETIFIPSISEKSLKELNGYKSAAENLKELSIFGKKYSIYILQELSKEVLEIKKIKEYGDRLDEIDSLFARLKKTYPFLGPIIDYFFHSKGMVQGENLLEITQNVFFVYEDYSTFLEIILELINDMNSRFTIIEKGK